MSRKLRAMKFGRRRPYRPAARSAETSHTPMTPEAYRDLESVAERCCEVEHEFRDRFVYTEPAFYCAVYDLKLLVPCEHMVQRGVANPGRTPRWWH